MMSRRQQPEALDFGSDSFLDIIANIVGILIILIVIAGVRVSRQPAPTNEVASAAPAVAVLPAEDDIEVEVEEVPMPDPVMPVETVQAEPDRRRVNAETLLQQQRALAKSQQQASKDAAQLAALVSGTRALADAVESKRRQVSQLEARVASLRQTEGTVTAQIQKIREELTEYDREQVSVEQIEHRVNPMGSDVSENEVHFRVKGGLVSHVPIDDLLKELKRTATQKRRILLQLPRFEGQVGPVRGYRMSYTIERRSSTLGEQLRYGGGVMRVMVSEWTVLATPNLEEETVAQATAPGSLFARRVIEAPANSNITFWVYPDSFKQFRALQSAVHREGLTVAGRPLPFGVEIAGSPNGTKSSGQ